MKRVYICTSCRPENFEYVNSLLTKIEVKDVRFFRPEPKQLLDKHWYARVDIQEINLADEVWLIGDYGRDCSWEVGYAQGLGKPVKVFVCNKNEAKLEEDWMLWPLLVPTDVIRIEE